MKIRINNCYLDKFKLSYNEYLYYIDRGLFLAFDKDTLEYKGLELFFLKDPKNTESKALEKINRLLSLGILEYN